MPKTPQPPMPDWEVLVATHLTPDFIAADPISLPHRYIASGDWRDIECAAFLTALFSYGRRDLIRQTTDSILAPLGPHPAAWLAEATPKALRTVCPGFYYRFNTAVDLQFLLGRLCEVYQDGGSLKALWFKSAALQPDLPHQIAAFRQAFLFEGHTACPQTYGMSFLFANPLQHSAAKRFNMFLRWMTRQDAVDLGLWADVLHPGQLMIPLDTHVAAMARQYRLTRRKSNDWKTAEEITAYFRRRCPEDPVRYDFALFGLGVTQAAAPQTTRAIRTQTASRKKLATTAQNSL